MEVGDAFKGQTQESSCHLDPHINKFSERRERIFLTSGRKKSSRFSMTCKLSEKESVFLSPIFEEKEDSEEEDRRRQRNACS